MNWWQRWKAKHWDETDSFGPNWYIPPLRRTWYWLERHWQKDPMQFLIAFGSALGGLGVLIGGFVALIQLLR